MFWRLGYSSLLDPDEAHYAALTREMLGAGNWLVPLLDGKPYIDKPVLFHWLQGASVLLFGETEFAARLPSAIAALILIAITRWVGSVLFGAAVGEWGALMFATIPATFALASVALFDMVFTTFLFGGLGCLLVATVERRRRVEWTGYALLTLAVMTKGPVALVLVGLFIVAASLCGREMRGQINLLHWKTGLVMVAVAASPWYLWMYWAFGGDFVRGYMLAGNLYYFTQPAVFSRRAVSHTFYARAFAGAFFPWSAVAVGRAIDAIRAKRGGIGFSTHEALLWTWVLVVLGFFSIARFKLDHYIFPAAPACCLLAAHAWRAASADTEGRLWATRASVIAVAALLVAAGSFGSVAIFELGLELPPIAILLPLAFVVGGIALMTQIAMRRWTLPPNGGVLMVMLLVVYIVVVAVGFPVLERTRPTAIVGRRLAMAAPASAPVGLYQQERWRGSLRYYLGRPIARLETPQELRDFLTQSRPVFVVMRRREFEALQRASVPVHLWLQHRAVVGTTGRGLRRQQWGFLVAVSNVPPPEPIEE